jgi:hypothetical protein
MMGGGALWRFGILQASIQSEWIKWWARISGDTGSWTRQRNMPLADMLMCTLGKKALSAVMEVRQFFQAAGKEEQTVSKQDYLRQRQKLNPEVFKILNQEYLQQFYGGTEAEGWHGYIVLAVDGSRAEIPNSMENRENYGESENQYGKAVARANISTAYDVYNRFILNIEIDNYRSGEIPEGKEHLGWVKAITGERPVLFIYDRNYVSVEFIDYLEKMGVKYLIRLKKGNYKQEMAGMESEDEEVALEHTKSRLQYLKWEDPERMEELERQGKSPARIIKMKFGGGEEGALITNMTECGAWELRKLYRKRWGIEQSYHTLKNKMKFESVTGKASVYVEQDFWAQIVVHNMVQDLITEAERKVVEKARKKAYRYEMRINENIAIGLFKEQFIRLMMEEDDERKNERFIRLKADMERNTVPVRTLKSRSRKWNYFNKYKCNLKPSF